MECTEFILLLQSQYLIVVLNYSVSNVLFVYFQNDKVFMAEFELFSITRLISLAIMTLAV